MDFNTFLFVSDVPQKNVNHLEIIGSKISILEAESLSGSQVQSLILSSNNIQQIADYAFR